MMMDQFIVEDVENTVDLAHRIIDLVIEDKVPRQTVMMACCLLIAHQLDGMPPDVRQKAFNLIISFLKAIQSKMTAA
jgi:hypothetical protein